MAKLIFGYPFMKQEYLLENKEMFYLGRVNSNDITIPDYDLFQNMAPAFQKEMFKDLMKISRIHARIIKQEGVWYIEDIGTKGFGSNYGTFVNKQRIDVQNPYLLKSNDKIGLGPFECTFIEDE